MSGVLLIAVSDGFGGYGDFLFALKLAEQIRTYYAENWGKDLLPEILLITEPSGKEKIKFLKGDEEFGIQVLTPDELKDHVEKNRLAIASIIEGPVFSSGLIFQINEALKSLLKPVPLVMMPEYAFNTRVHRNQIKVQENYRANYLDKIIFQNIIFTGFDSKLEENGIILSKSLMHPPPPEVLVSQLDDYIKQGLFSGHDIQSYQEDTELYFQYSHDIYSDKSNCPSAERFLKIHRNLAKDSKKNQDVFMVGKHVFTKKQALSTIKHQLIEDGYSKISFYDLETKFESYIHGQIDTPGRHYRVVYTPGMSHPSMIAAQALSGDLMGVTGDQSFGEGISSNKLLIYECLSHKKSLMKEYYRQLKQLDPECGRLLHLLETANTESEYKEIAKLYSPEMKARLIKLNQAFIKSIDLIKIAALASMPVDSINKLILAQKINPYTSYGSLSPFQRLLKAKNFTLIDFILVHHTATDKDKRIFCETLSTKDNQGKSFFSTLRAAHPNSQATRKISYLITRFHIERYKVPPDSPRETMFNAYKDLSSTFTSLGAGTYNEKALIGLLLLTTKNIANEYTFMSPDKGPFFGSRFYTHLKGALSELGVNLKTITPKQRQVYYKALASYMDSNPHLISNEYIVKTLSKQAHLVLPKMPPLLGTQQAIKLLSSNGKDNDPTVIKTQKGLYKTHSIPLGKGGWGKVYAARHYSMSENGMETSQPLAIKVVQKGNQNALDKEGSLFKKVYSQGHFERFNVRDTACLAMPLIAGVPLDKYLSVNLSIPQSIRQLMACSLLENLSKIHEKGVIHLDIKPKNMLYDPVTRKVCLIDFGSAEPVDVLVPFTDIDHAKFGLEYLPSEHLRNEVLTTKSDVYSLTLSLAEILGANKHDLVKMRMDRALSKVGDERLKTIIRSGFHSSGSLDESMFTKELYAYRNHAEFHRFISEFINEPYDFDPYSKRLGKDTVSLLNQMQHHDPNQRPDIKEILEHLKIETSEMKWEISP